MTEQSAPVCDAPNQASAIYIDGTCRCLICARCGHHTGNSTQGHWWRLCSVTHSARDFHFCCPGDCELEDPVAAARIAAANELTQMDEELDDRGGSAMFDQRRLEATHAE